MFLLDNHGKLYPIHKRLLDAVAVIFLADLKVRVWQAALSGPPALRVAVESAGANHAQLIAFGKIFNRNNDGHNG